jgi:hypothetical protein
MQVTGSFTSYNIMECDNFRIVYTLARTQRAQCGQPIYDRFRELMARNFLTPI